MKRYMKVAVVAVAASVSGAAAQQPRTITLQDAITIALRQSSDVARAEHQQALDELAVSDSKSRFLPDLSFSCPSRCRPAGHQPGDPAGEHRRVHAELAVNDLQRRIAVDVRRTVLDRKSAEASLAAAESRVAAATQAVDATEKRYQAGVATLFEVTQSRADLVEAKSAEVRARYTLQFQDVMLEYHTGELAFPQQ